MNCAQGSFQFHFQVCRNKCQYFHKLFRHNNKSTSEILLIHWLIYFCHRTSHIVVFAKVFEPVIFSFLFVHLRTSSVTVLAPLNEVDLRGAVTTCHNVTNDSIVEICPFLKTNNWYVSLANKSNSYPACSHHRCCIYWNLQRYSNSQWVSLSYWKSFCRSLYLFWYQTIEWDDTGNHCGILTVWLQIFGCVKPFI